MSDVSDYKEDGFAITAENKDFVTFAVPKSFNWWLFILLLIVGFYGAWIYVIVYKTQNPTQFKTLKKETKR